MKEPPGLADAYREAVDRIRRAHAIGHVPTSIVTYCGESDGISATYCETGTLLRAIAVLTSSALQEPTPNEQ